MNTEFLISSELRTRIITAIDDSKINFTIYRGFPESPKDGDYHYEPEMRKLYRYEHIAAYWNYIILPDPVAAPGAKNDAGKPLTGLLLDFSLALNAVIDVGTHGAEKYSRDGWTHSTDPTRYTDAMMRHLFAESNEEVDPDSGYPHEYHVAWNALARLELKLRESTSLLEIDTQSPVKHV